MENQDKKEGTVNEGAVKPSASESEELKTEGPISEKDEVKRAEDKTTESAQKR